MDYEKDMLIDENALEIEWLDQAPLANKYGRNWAKCQMELELAQEEIKLVRSELIKKVNEDPVKWLGDGIKATGPVVEAYYRNHRRHQEVKTKIVNLQYETNVAEIAFKEISITRKKALENLVTLHGQQYFAGPAIPRDIKWEREEKKKKANEGIGKKLRRRRKDA